MNKTATLNKTVELAGSIGSWLAPLLLYIATIAPNVSAGDSGDFILATHRFSLPDSSGYPLYMMLLKIWSVLPIGIGPDPLAFKTNLFSAVLMAATCGIFYRLTRTLTGSLSASLAATLVLAVSRTLWKYSVVTEVYALNMLLIVLVLAGLAIAREGKKPIGLVLTAFAFGLGLTHHPSILLLIPMIFFLWPKKMFKKGVPVAGIVAGFILPLVFYLFLPVMASNTPRYAEEGFTAGNFVDTVTHADYRTRAASVDLPPEEIIQPKDVLARSTGWLFRQFGWLSWILLPLSIVGWFMAPSGKRFWALWCAKTAIIWIFAVSFLTRGNPLGMPISYLRSVDELLIPVMIFLAMGFAWILKPLADSLETRKDFAGTEGQNVIPPGQIPIAIMLLLCAIAVLAGITNKRYSNMARHTFVQDQARNIIEQVPDNGVLVVKSDEMIMFVYLQEVRGIRQDVELTDSLTDIFTEDLDTRGYVFTSNEAAQAIEYIYPPKALRLDGVALTLVDREEGMPGFLPGDPNIWTQYQLRNLDHITLNSLVIDDFEYEVFDRYVNGLRATIAHLGNTGYAEDLATLHLTAMADVLEQQLDMTNYPSQTHVDPTTGE